MKARYISYLVILFVGFSCKTTGVTVLKDNDFRIDKYTSFDFFETDAQGDISEDYESNMALVKDEVQRQMESRGVKRSKSDPELKVNIGILVKEEVQTRETGLVTDPGTFNYIGQRRYTWRSETIEVGKYKEGTATLHLVETASDRAVWEGVLEEVIPGNPEKIKEAIVNGVRKFFDKIDENP